MGLFMRVINKFGENMRKLLFLLIPILFIVLPFTSHGEEASSIAKPAVYGVLLYADWCGSCKALDPKITQAREEAKLDTKDVLFVTLDLTDEITKHQAAMMAATLGITDIYEANAGKTGFMLLLDADSGQKLAQVTNKYKSTEIAAKIQESIKAAKS
jgi:thiol-disulfide isomerase/thioredoxin